MNKWYWYDIKMFVRRIEDWIIHVLFWVYALLAMALTFFMIISFTMCLTGGTK